MSVIKGKVNGNVNIGLYAILNNKVAFIAKGFQFSFDFKDVFGVKDVIEFSAYETPFIGIFSAINNNGVLFSGALTDKEKQYVMRTIKERNIDIRVGFLNEKRSNVIGNLILCNDTGAIIGEPLKKHKKEIQDILDVEVMEVSKIMDVDIVGSLGVATNKGFLISAYATEDEYSVVRDILGVSGDIGTVNYGSPFVSSGILVNDLSLVLGDDTTPVEMARAVESLGFL